MKNKLISLESDVETTNGFRNSKFRIRALRRVQKDALRVMTEQQRREAIDYVKRLECYPNIGSLNVSPCGDGYELRVNTPAVNRRGWLRVLFQIEARSRTIIIVHLFWKKTNKISLKDIHCASGRIQAMAA